MTPDLEKRLEQQRPGGRHREKLNHWADDDWQCGEGDGRFLPKTLDGSRSFVEGRFRSDNGGGLLGF